MRRIAFFASLALLSLTPLAANALLIITPSTPALTGTQTAQSQIDAAIAGALGGSVLLYKKNVDSWTETGSFASSYNTAFFNSESDPSDATITHVGGSPVMSATHLLVKDGNHSPAWYLFDLSWNGTETIWLHNFWPKGGAISHVTFYGRGTTTQVPEPATMGLLGAGLLAFGFLRRRKLA